MKKRIKIGNIIIAILSLIFLIVTGANAQTTPYNKPKNLSLVKVWKQQKEQSWENYQRNLKKNLISEAKDQKKAKKQKEKEEKSRERLLARIERIKE